MSSLSALMLTINFGKTSLSFVEFIQLSDRGSGFVKSADIYHFYKFVCVCILSEDVLPSIHADPEYPCELVGTWNTWYGEQDQAGESTNQNLLLI